TRLDVAYRFSKAGADKIYADGTTLTLTQPLLRSAGWRATTSAVHDAHLSADAEEAALRGKVLGVMFDVKSAYYEVLRRQRLIEEDAWIDRALRENPDVQRARLQLQRDELAMHVAGNGRLPQLDLRVSYDDLTDKVLESSKRGLRPHVQTWSGAVTMSYPLFN